MAAIELLTAAQTRIGAPEKWTQGTYARDAAGQKCLPEDKQAASWCALGALIAESSDMDCYSSALEFLREVARVFHGGSKVTVINDRGSHADVMRLYAGAVMLAGEGR